MRTVIMSCAIIFLMIMSAQSPLTSAQSQPAAKPANTPKPLGVVDGALFQGVLEANLENVEKALAQGANVKARNAEGKTALMLTPYPEIVKALIAAGGDINAKDREGRSVLMVLLAEHNADVSLVKMLIDAGADLTVRDMYGNTCAMWAVRMQNADALRLMLAVALERKLIDKHDLIALFNVGIYFPDCLSVLLEAGLDVNMAVEQSVGMVSFAVMEPRILKQLLNYGLNPNVFDKRGQPILITSVGGFNANLEITQLLIRAGADLNIEDPQGRTPLIAAVEAGNIKALKLLLEAGANVNARTKKGLTAVLILGNSYKPECMQMLIKAGADLNAQDRQGRTALMQLAEVGNTGAVKELVAGGADLNMRDNNGQTALMLAIDRYPYPETIRELLAAGADIEIADNNGETALSIARRDGRQEIVELLVAVSEGR